LANQGQTHQVFETRLVEGRAGHWAWMTTLRDLDLLRWATENPCTHSISFLSFIYPVIHSHIQLYIYSYINCLVIPDTELNVIHAKK